jgi:peptide/nickel transport system permease protein
MNLGGTKASTWRRMRRDPRIHISLAIIVCATLTAILAPWIAPTDPQEMDISLRLCPPDATHWLGCDLNGGDVLTAMIFGARTSLYVGFVTVLLSLTLGVIVGLVAGYKRGTIDNVFMRLVDLLMAFPGILLAMALTALLGPSSITSSLPLLLRDGRVLPASSEAKS